MRQRMVACLLALVGATTPHCVDAAAPATLESIRADPHYAAWIAALEAAAAAARSPATASPAPGCGALDALRPLVQRTHETRDQLLRSLAGRGVTPVPPPGPGVAWPWGPGAGVTPRVAARDTLDTAVFVDDGRLLSMNLNGAPEVDPLAAAQAFYHDYDDEYDFLLLFTNFYSELFLGRYLSYHLAVANDIEGLGYVHVYGTDHFNDGPQFTGNSELGALQSFVHLNDLRAFPDSMTSPYWHDYTPPAFVAHELGHRWGARLRLCPTAGPAAALLGRGDVHWSFFFDSRASVLEGSAWDGTPPDFVSGPPTRVYSPLDLYLMGMLAESEVPAGTLWYMANPYDCSPSVDRYGNPWEPASTPVQGVRCSGDRIDFDMDCIQAMNGARKPAAAAAPKSFRIATMLVTTPATPLAPSDLDELQRLRAAVAAYFQVQTLGRGSLDFRTHPVPARVLFLHLPQGDVEDPTPPIPIRTRVALESRSLPTTLDDVRVFLHWSSDGGAWTAIEMTRDGTDTFAAAIPAQALDSQVRYYLRGTTVLSAHENVLPAGAPGTTFSFRIAPDTTPPTIAHVPVRRHSRNAEPVLLRAVVRDAHAVASVDVEYGLTGTPTTSQPLQRQGVTDVWEARLELPGGVGDQVDYRIVARDSAATPHVTTAPAVGFSGIAVTLVQYEDVESEDPLWTHRSLALDGLDEWHRERHNHTTGGRFSWKLGPDNISTNPRAGQMALEQDAALESPAVLLLEGWEVRFYHRYYFRVAPLGTDRSGMDGGIVQVQFVDHPDEVQQDRWWLVETDAGYPMQLGGYAYFNPLQWYPCWSGTYDSWKFERISADYFPELTGERVRVRFRAASSIAWDGTQPGAGWYIDDIEIDPGMAVPVTLEELQAQRTASGVLLGWKARDVASGDTFRLSRAGLAAGNPSQPGRFEPLATLAADPATVDYHYLDTQASPVQAYAYRVTLVRGDESTSRDVSVGAAALRFALHPNRPNPFNPTTQIAFDLPARAATALVVYDVRGTRVRTLVSGTLEAGPHRLTWDGTDDRDRPVASGVYVAALASAGQRATRRLLLLR